MAALETADGWGVLRGTPVGEAGIEWTQARNDERRCLALAEDAGFRQRRQLRHQAERAARREPALRDAFERLAAPERERIGAELPQAKKHLAELEGRHWAHLHFELDRPDALRRVDRLERDIADARYCDLDLERQSLDGISPKPRPAPRLGRKPDALEHDLDVGLGL